MENLLKMYHSVLDCRKTILQLETSKKVVYTYGVWDLLHPGHIKLLIRARKLGDFLVVGVVKDKPIKCLKGKDRPIQSLNERLFIVSALKCVDVAIVQSEYDPSRELRKIGRVDILVKGDDWERIPGGNTIRAMGGKLIKLSYSSGYSTSALVSKISGKPIVKHREPKC